MFLTQVAQDPGETTTPSNEAVRSGTTEEIAREFLYYNCSSLKRRELVGLLQQVISWAFSERMHLIMAEALLSSHICEWVTQKKR